MKIRGAIFSGANKGYEKKVEGCENSHGKFKGCENFHGKFKGCENICRKIKGYEKSSPFSVKHSNRVSGLKKDRPLKKPYKTGKRALSSLSGSDSKPCSIYIWFTPRAHNFIFLFASFLILFFQKRGKTGVRGQYWRKVLHSGTAHQWVGAKHATYTHTH